MKNERGFTLIELLAVIVILAIIAVIATPIILGVIDDAKKSAANDSAYGALDALKTYYATSQITTNPASLPLVAKFGDSTYSPVGDETVITGTDLSMSGTKPTVGVIKLAADGTFTTPTNLVVNGYTCTYTNQTFNCGA